jgi:tyrosyl-tRNA synthetase
MKMLDLAGAGFKQTLLLADYHAYMDDMKTPWELMEARTEYYRRCIETLVDKKSGIEIIVGSSFQKKADYLIDVLKSSAMATVARATRAASETCRMEDPKVSSLIYPLMQSLDCAYLDVDCALGGVDQRHVYMLSREILPELGYRKPVCLFAPIVMSLKGGTEKVSASKPGTGFLVHDSEKDIEKAIMNAYCPEKDTKGNPIVQICRYILFPKLEKLEFKRPAKFGGTIGYSNITELENDYSSGKLHPMDLKAGVAVALADLLKPARDYFEKHPEVIERAYEK